MNLNKKTFIRFIVFLGFLFLFVGTNAQENKIKYLNYSISLGGDLDYNIYSSQFRTLPGTTNCCEKDNILFEKATGLGYSFWVGATRHIDSPLIFTGLDANINLKFINFAAKYSEKAKIGNYINNNNIEDIISQQVLSTSANFLTISPSVSVFPFDKSNLPLALHVGFSSGIFLSSNYEMYEEILQPTGALFENGGKIRNNSSGDLQDKSDFFFSFFCGFSYELLKINSISLSSLITFNYGITNFLKSIDWKSNTINFGLNIAYRFKEPEKILPAPPVLPPLPALPLLKEEKINMFVETNILPENKKIKTGDTIFLQINNTSVITSTTHLPILFFKLNSSELIKEKKIDDKLVTYLLNNTKNINYIEIGLAVNEKEDLFEKRKHTVLEFCSKNKINTSNFKFSYIKSDKKRKYLEINEEMAYAKFGNDLVVTEELENQYKIDSIQKKLLEVKVQVESENNNHNYKHNYNYNCEIKYNINKINIENNINNIENILVGRALDTNLLLELDKNININNININKNISLDISINTISQKKLTKNFEFLLVPNIITREFVNSNAENYFTEEYVLGFFNFDEKYFIQVDTNVVNKISTYLEKNYKIEIIGCTDSFGTMQHNQILALERANAAKKLFPEKYNCNITVVTGKMPKETNNSAYSRLQNRVALVRIIK